MKTSLVILILLSLIFIVCDNGTKPAPEQIVYKLDVPKTEFERTDTLTGEFIVTNQSESEKVFTFLNLQQHGFTLTDQNNTVVILYPTGFHPALTSFRLQPNESKTYPIRTEFRDQNGQLLDPGTYTLSAYLLDGEYPKVSTTIKIR